MGVGGWASMVIFQRTFPKDVGGWAFMVNFLRTFPKEVDGSASMVSFQRTFPNGVGGWASMVNFQRTFPKGIGGWASIVIQFPKKLPKGGWWLGFHGHAISKEPSKGRLVVGLPWSCNFQRTFPKGVGGWASMVMQFPKNLQKGGWWLGFYGHAISKEPSQRGLVVAWASMIMQFPKNLHKGGCWLGFRG
jgi:hypothetical protein